MTRATKNLAEVIRQKLASDPALAQKVEEERFNLDVSAEVFRVRNELKLTQKELAGLMHTHQSVIARMEDADYYGHTLKLLQRVAEATGNRLEVRFVHDRPAKPKGKKRSDEFGVPRPL